MDLEQLRSQLGKPIRVAWANRSYFHPTDLYKGDAYCLLVLCSASRRVQGAEISEGGYIQGAGDDSEGWAHGLTPSVFWENQDILKSTPEEGLPVLIKELVAGQSRQGAGHDATLIGPTSNLFIGVSDALKEAGVGPYDLVIDCNGDPAAVEGKPKRLNLGCASAKLGSRDLRKSLDKVRDFVWGHLGSDSSLSLLVMCENGKDLSAGTLLAIICLFYNDEGMVTSIVPGKELCWIYSDARWNGKGNQGTDYISSREIRRLAGRAFRQQTIYPTAASLDRIIKARRESVPLDASVGQRVSHVVMLSPDGRPQLVIESCQIESQAARPYSSVRNVALTRSRQLPRWHRHFLDLGYPKYPCPLC